MKIKRKTLRIQNEFEARARADNFLKGMSPELQRQMLEGVQRLLDDPSEFTRRLTRLQAEATAKFGELHDASFNAVDETAESTTEVEEPTHDGGTSKDNGS